MNDPHALVEDLVCQCLQARDERDARAIERLLAAQPAAVREQVEAMLGTLDRVGLAGAAVTHPTDTQALPFGPYLLLERLGAGAMGVVYRARDAGGTERALKVLQPGLLPIRRARLRFEREIQALRELDHPGICPILDAGEVDGVPFLVMPLLAGESLQAQFARGVPRDDASRQRVLTVVEHVATALHHAHERGFVHRDVKPANILVGTDGRAIVLDFGLARRDRDDGASLSQSHEVIGAPAYMAPEQIADGHAVDRRADVYALGVLLYEGLTGRCPYEAATRESLYRRILTGDAAAPSLRVAGLPRPFDVVCMTALAREADRRYQTAAAFAADLGRVRAGLPPLAQLPGWLERTRRWIRRNPLPSTLVALLAVAVVVALLQTMQERRASARDRARVLAAEAFEVLPSDSGRAEELGLRALALAPDVLDSQSAIEAARAAEREEFVLTGHTRPVTDLHFANDGERLVSASLDGTARVWQLQTGSSVELRHGGDGAMHAAIAPNGEVVATADRGEGRLCVWSARSGALLWEQRLAGGVHVLHWSPDGSWLFVGGAGGASLWSPAGERREVVATDAAVTAAAWLTDDEVVVGTGPRDGGPADATHFLRRVRLGAGALETVESHDVTEGIVSLHPRTRVPDRAIAIGTSGTAWLWRFDAPSVTKLPDAHTRGANGAGWDAHGERGLTIGPGGVMAFWTAEGKEQRPTVPTLGAVSGFLLHPRQPFAAISGGYGALQLRSLDGAGAQLLGRRRVLALPIAFSADGRRLAACRHDHSVRVWAMWRPEHPMFFPGDSVRTVVWTHDGRQVLTGSLRTWTERRGVVRRWDVATGELIGRALVVDGGVMCLLIDSRAEVVMALSGKRDSGHLHVVSRRGGELSADGTTIDTGLGLPIDGRVLDDGRVVAAGEEGGIVVCDLTTGVVEQRWPVVPPELGPAGPGYLQAVCATPDGRTIWCGGSSGFLHRFDRRVDGTYAEVAPRYLGEFIRALQYVDDDSLLVGLANGILYRLRRDGTGPPLTFAGHQGDVTDVDWVRRNGELLVASGDWSGNVRLWRGDGSLHREIRAHSGPVLSVRFSPQGDRLLTGADDGTARIWRVDLELPR